VRCCSSSRVVTSIPTMIPYGTMRAQTP
jgi:hypothetical protein